MNAPDLPPGWSVVASVAQDGSARRYSRIEKNGRTAILMDYSQGETPGHSLKEFIHIAQWLNGIDLKAPKIYEQSDKYLIVEDFGDMSFKKAAEKRNTEDFYRLAADVLTHLRSQKKIPHLPGYFESNVYKGHRRIIDWYTPCVRHIQNPDGLVESYLAVWEEIEKNLPVLVSGFVHADFHVENLMYLPNEKGLKSCGILDFQGALLGPIEYDLGNLLEDVRVDVPLAIREKILNKENTNFKAWYRVLTTQFHCRVIGQFIKMAAKDHKTGYLQYIPRTQNYIREALDDPLLHPLKIFFEKNSIHLSEKPDLQNIKQFVRPDAF